MKCCFKTSIFFRSLKLTGDYKSYDRYWMGRSYDHTTSPLDYRYTFNRFFVLQTLAIFIGFGDHDMDVGHGDVSGDVDADVDGAGIFTIRNTVAFFLGLSWGGLAFLETYSEVTAILIGAAIGVVLVVTNLLLLKGLSQLKSSGNINLNNAIGTTAVVTVLIPPQQSSYGKVMATFQGRSIEVEAVTKGANPLSRSSVVNVDSVSNGLLVVS